MSVTICILVSIQSKVVDVYIECKQNEIEDGGAFWQRYRFEINHRYLRISLLNKHLIIKVIMERLSSTKIITLWSQHIENFGFLSIFIGTVPSSYALKSAFADLKKTVNNVNRNRFLTQQLNLLNEITRILDSNKTVLLQIPQGYQCLYLDCFQITLSLKKGTLNGF